MDVVPGYMKWVYKADRINSIEARYLWMHSAYVAKGLLKRLISEKIAT